MEQNHLSTQTGQPVSLAKPMLVGAVLGLLVISAFVFGSGPVKPEWGNLWRIKPLLVTPAAGALGGAFYYLMDRQASRGLNRTVAVILSLVIFFIVLWLGIVLGLAGTMWD